MGFFSDWKTKNQEGLSTADYIVNFIISDDYSLSSFENANDIELESAYEILSSVRLCAFLDELSKLQNVPKLTAADVPCFSTMENGASRLNELLVFSPDGLTFSEIGYQLKLPTPKHPKKTITKPKTDNQLCCIARKSQ